MRSPRSIFLFVLVVRKNINDQQETSYVLKIHKARKQGPQMSINLSQFKVSICSPIVALYLRNHDFYYHKKVISVSYNHSLCYLLRIYVSVKNLTLYGIISWLPGITGTCPVCDENQLDLHSILYEIYPHLNRLDLAK